MPIRILDEVVYDQILKPLINAALGKGKEAAEDNSKKNAIERDHTNQVRKFVARIVDDLNLRRLQNRYRCGEREERIVGDAIYILFVEPQLGSRPVLDAYGHQTDVREIKVSDVFADNNTKDDIADFLIDLDNKNALQWKRIIDGLHSDSSWDEYKEKVGRVFRSVKIRGKIANRQFCRWADANQERTEEVDKFAFWTAIIFGALILVTVSVAIFLQ